MLLAIMAKGCARHPALKLCYVCSSRVIFCELTLKGHARAGVRLGSGYLEWLFYRAR